MLLFIRKPYLYTQLIGTDTTWPVNAYMIHRSDRVSRYRFHQHQVFQFVDSFDLCSWYWMHFTWELIFIPYTWWRSSFDCFSSAL